MNCASCDKPKNELFPKESALLKGVQLYMCKSCIDGKMEPRWTIILAGRQYGHEKIRDYIVKHRYSGEVIKAEEIVK